MDEERTLMLDRLDEKGEDIPGVIGRDVWNDIIAERRKRSWRLAVSDWLWSVVPWLIEKLERHRMLIDVSHLRKH